MSIDIILSNLLRGTLEVCYIVLVQNNILI